MSEYTDKIMKIFLNNKEHGTGGLKMTEYLSREDILDIASQYCTDDDGSCSKADVDIREMLDEIEALPSADVQPVKRGTWIIDNDYYTCSRCNHQYLKDKILSMTIYSSGGIPYYCPCCGADMRNE